MVNNIAQFVGGGKILIRPSDIAGKNRQAFKHTKDEWAQQAVSFLNRIIWFNKSNFLCVPAHADPLGAQSGEHAGSEGAYWSLPSTPLNELA